MAPLRPDLISEWFYSIINFCVRPQTVLFRANTASWRHDRYLVRLEFAYSQAIPSSWRGRAGP